MAVKVVEGRDYRILQDDYRAEFHKHNKPIRVEKKIVNGQVIQMRYYRCMYCGKLVPHTEMQVDHIIPKTRLMAGILWNPNKAWNLGPSCPKCNIAKSNYIDSRVIKGFRNKLISKYGLAHKFADWAGKDMNLAEETTAGDDERLQKIMPYIMTIVYALGILRPLIIIAAWVLQAAMFVGVRAFRILKAIFGKFGRWLWKKTKKTFKYYLKYPRQIWKLAGKIALVSALVYFGLAYIGGPTVLVSYITNFFGTIWGIGSGFFKKLMELFIK